MLLLGAGSAWLFRSRRARRDDPDPWPTRPPAADPPATLGAEPAAPAPEPTAPAPPPAPAPLPAAAPEPLSPRSTAGAAANGTPYGPGSARPLADGSAPSSEYTIKGNVSSKLYHAPSSPYYKRTKAQVWFRSGADAAVAGFTEWQPRKRS